MFTVEVNQSFNVLEQTWNNQIYLKLYVSLFSSGLVAELGTERTLTLLAIASFMNNKGECYPTQEQLAERLGMTRKTVSKHIRSLLEYRYQGRPLVLREKRRNPRVSPNAYSIYTVLPLSQVAIFDSNIDSAMGNVLPQGGNGETPPMGKTEKAMGKIEPPMGKTEDVPMGNCLPINKNQLNQNHYNKTINNIELGSGTVGNTDINPTDLTHPKNIIEYFCEKYRQRYTVNYNPNWKRDVGLVKNKLVAVYEPVQIRMIIDTVFAEYDTRWKKDAYPRPSIGQLATWLSNEALAVGEEQQQTDFTQVKRHGGYSVEAIMARLERGSGKE
nr:helix-turn-helix domain-containing protein [Heliobacterium chlorum]